MKSYFAIFQSHINYFCLVWCLTSDPKRKESIVKQKTILHDLMHILHLYLKSQTRIILYSYNQIELRSYSSVRLIRSYSSVTFGRKSIIQSITVTWNHLQDKLNEYDLLKSITKKPGNFTSQVIYIYL